MTDYFFRHLGIAWGCFGRCQPKPQSTEKMSVAVC